MIICKETEYKHIKITTKRSLLDWSAATKDLCVLSDLKPLKNSFILFHDSSFGLYDKTENSNVKIKSKTKKRRSNIAKTNEIVFRFSEVSCS